MNERTISSAVRGSVVEEDVELTIVESGDRGADLPGQRGDVGDGGGAVRSIGRGVRSEPADRITQVVSSGRICHVRFYRKPAALSRTVKSSIACV